MLQPCPYRQHCITATRPGHGGPRLLRYLHNSAAACHVQTTLFHGDACEALGEDAALELVDWAARRLLWLNSRIGRACAKIAGASASAERLNVCHLCRGSRTRPGQLPWIRAC